MEKTKEEKQLNAELEKKWSQELENRVDLFPHPYVRTIVLYYLTKVNEREGYRLYTHK